MCVYNLGTKILMADVTIDDANSMNRLADAIVPTNSPNRNPFRATELIPAVVLKVGKSGLQRIC